MCNVDECGVAFLRKQCRRTGWEGEKWTKEGEARRVVGQERPQVLADGVLYVCKTQRHRVTHIHVFFRHFSVFCCNFIFIFCYCAGKKSFFGFHSECNAPHFFKYVKTARCRTNEMFWFHVLVHHDNMTSEDSEHKHSWSGFSFLLCVYLWFLHGGVEYCHEAAVCN